jgi:hypothetical protein
MSYRPKPQLSDVPNEPDNLYYDVLITNYNSISGEPIPIRFNENRTNPIINNTGDYELSIIRFQVDTTDIPVFIPVIQPYTSGNTVTPNIDKTNYFVSMEIKPVGSSVNYISSAQIIWVTQDSAAVVPPNLTATNPYQSPVGNYYHCYSFQHFQQLVTTAMVKCFKNLQSAIVGAGYADLTGILPPVMAWDANNSTAVISVPQLNSLGNPCFDSRYIDGSGNLVTNPNGVNLYFNAPLFQLFNSFVFFVFLFF